MKSLVTTKGQVTIPKAFRDRLGISPGTQVDFSAAEDGLRLRKVVDRSKRTGVLGCLREELAKQSLPDLLEDLRGPVDLPASIPKRPRR